MRRVYMDYAATTPVDPRVLEAMKPYFLKKYGNSMSLHAWGREAKEALENSRETVASLMNADQEEVIFLGSGTEGSNMVLKGTAFANRKKGKHIIVSSIEHHCVLESARWLERQGFEITYLPVDKYGLVDLNALENAIKKDTILVSVMHANNEIGTIEPVEEIGKLCREKGIYFYSDAAQSYGKIPVDVEKMNVDLLMVDAHKIYGPKGTGALFIRKGTKIEPLLHGGGHEFGLRSSTVNVASIVGFAKAVEIQKKEMNSDANKQTKFRDRLIKEILKIEDSHLNGHPTKRLPNNAHFWFAYIEGESLITQLDMHGIAASTGSACSSESLEPSHVLLAIGLKPQEAHGSLRLTTGKYTTKKDVDYVLEILPKAVKRLREISPFKGGWE
ncbi:MAG: cysteine desulfurase family protein [Candidatus Aenigmarchaeota archaeon]|nr:cysteine desulfurase family protein [Candidatus Aenigmarchaeota archaeon]